MKKYLIIFITLFFNKQMIKFDIKIKNNKYLKMEGVLNNFLPISSTNLSVSSTTSITTYLQNFPIFTYLLILVEPGPLTRWPIIHR
jgi:hypothetical protein